jgi:hypothetical protein
MRRLLVVLTLGVVLFSAGCKPKQQATSPTPTRFVTADGSWTSNCTAEAPCNLWRASTIVGTSALPAGSHVLVRRGIYSQAQMSFKGSGTAESPILFRFEEGATLTSTRVKPTTWTLTSGTQYVYETPFTETTWTVGGVAQRAPATWTPILVDDRRPPHTVSAGRPFNLTIPPPFKWVVDLASVERQSGTWTASTAQGKVYVHMYHDGPPTSADDLYIAPRNWGSVIIDGDDLQFENLRLEKTTGVGFYVRNSSARTALRNLVADAAQVWLEGWSTQVDGITVSHHISQGSPGSAECYDANPNFGVGECWNAYGDGRGLLIGRGGKAGGYQTIRNALVTRGWNGMRIDGWNTIDGCLVWGMPNHAMEASGEGFKIRNCVVLDSQDSLFMKSNPANNFLIEQNIFYGAVYVTTSNDGNGGTPVGSWTFRRNLLRTLGMDRHAFNGLTESDCNVYTADRDLWRVITTNGIAGFDYNSLDQIRANTPFEESSLSYPSTFWTQGPAFRQFSAPYNPFDFRDPLGVCGSRVGPTTFYPPPPFIG